LIPKKESGAWLHGWSNMLHLTYAGSRFRPLTAPLAKSLKLKAIDYPRTALFPGTGIALKACSALETIYSALPGGHGAARMVRVV